MNINNLHNSISLLDYFQCGSEPSIIVRRADTNKFIDMIWIAIQHRTLLIKCILNDVAYIYYTCNRAFPGGTHNG